MMLDTPLLRDYLYGSALRDDRPLSPARGAEPHRSGMGGGRLPVALALRTEPMWDSFKMLATLTDELTGVPAGADRLAPPLLDRHPSGEEEEEDEIFDDDIEDDEDLDEEDDLDDEDLDEDDLDDEEGLDEIDDIDLDDDDLDEDDEDDDLDDLDADEDEEDLEEP
jgi:hypothetical protein